METALIGINEAVMNFFPKDENKLSKYETKGQRLYTKRDPSYFQQIEANLKRINDEL